MEAKIILEIGCACETCKKNGGGCERFPTGRVPVGTIWTRFDAYLLVRAGVAVANDEECEAAVKMTPQQLEHAQYWQRRTAKGIHPDDFAAYEAGEMDGYYPDGSWIAGPNTSETDEGLILP